MLFIKLYLEETIMTGLPKKIIFEHNIFEFSATACECKIGTNYTPAGDVRHVFYLYPQSCSIYYTYAAGKGLVSSKDKKMGKGREVIPDLLAIKGEDWEGVKAFIERHGFLSPLDFDSHLEVEGEPLLEFFVRLRTTMVLMQAIADENAHYEKILALTLYLLLSPQVKIDLPKGRGQLATCPHEMGQLWNNTCQPDSNNDIADLQPNNEWESTIPRRAEVDIKPLPQCHIEPLPPDSAEPGMGQYIPDSIRSLNVWLDMNTYNYAFDYLENNPGSARAKSTILFNNAYNVTPHSRLAIDFLYNLCEDVGEIKTWNQNGELTFCENSQPSSALLQEKLDDQLRKGLLKLAEQTLKTEIDYHLHMGVALSYDTEAMAPTWRINHLLSGLYFSIFYMQPDIAIYRACQNPSCGHYFLVSATTRKKMYCSPSCSNAVQQRKSRRRKKEQSANGNSTPGERV